MHKTFSLILLSQSGLSKHVVYYFHIICDFLSFIVQLSFDYWSEESFLSDWFTLHLLLLAASLLYVFCVWSHRRAPAQNIVSSPWVHCCRTLSSLMLVDHCSRLIGSCLHFIWFMGCSQTCSERMYVLFGDFLWVDFCAAVFLVNLGVLRDSEILHRRNDISFLGSQWIMKGWVSDVTWLWPCSNATKTRNPFKFAGVPQTPEWISAVSGPKLTTLWRHVDRYCCLTSFFQLSIHALVAKT